MLIYIFILLLLLFNINNDKKGPYIVFSLILFLIGFLRTETVGTDVRSYCELFDGISSDFFSLDSLGLMYSDIELGFIFFIKAIKHMVSDAMTIVRILFLLYFVCIYYCILKLSVKPILTLFVYLSLSFYFFSFNGIRQALAISFSLLIITFFIQNGPTFKRAISAALGILIIAFLFHKSLVISIVAPFVILFSKSKYLSNKKLVGIILVSLIVSVFLNGLLVQLFSSIDISFLGSDKYNSYLEGLSVKNNFSYMSNALHAFFSIFLLLTTKKRNMWLQLYSIGTMILVLLSPMSWLFIRVADNLNIYLILAIPLIWNEWNNNKAITMYRVGIILYCLVLFANRLKDDNFQDVVPYACILFN